MRKNAPGAVAKARRVRINGARRSLAALLFALSVAPRSGAQLPDAPSASVIAPLRRFSLSIGLDNKYSLSTSLYDIAPRLGLSVRVGQRETLGISYARSMVMNSQHVQSNAVAVSATFRVLSWGKIPKDR